MFCLIVGALKRSRFVDKLPITRQSVVVKIVQAFSSMNAGIRRGKRSDMRVMLVLGCNVSSLNIVGNSYTVRKSQHRTNFKHFITMYTPLAVFVFLCIANGGD
ncbi:hypothetical protein NPIL_311491 [Nephila pilipes]|uniref:Uncharacterized protein n=1 Tax=Nephila pilipes TaxID=299642 RepID=A0A8X6TSN8_NEPPI|nr:hypothetical protein NPIL_311491 [Nephila pilipes]